MYERFRHFLLSLGVEKPRVKIIPVFPIGRMAATGGSVLSEETLQGFDFLPHSARKPVWWRMEECTRVRFWQG